MIVLAIDPGVHECALALVEHGALVRVWFAKDPWSIGWDDRHRLDLIVVERPEYQGARTDAARAQDTLALAWAGARLAYFLAGVWGVPVREVPPSEWIKGEQKPPRLLRLWNALTPEKQAFFPAHTGALARKAAEACALKPGRPGASYYGRGKGHEVHNLLDAAALGLWHEGRFR